MRIARPSVRRMVAGVVLALVVTTAVSPATSSAAVTPRIDLKVLVVNDGSAPVEAIASELSAAGVPFTELDLGSATRPTVTAAYLSDKIGTTPRAKYQAVVLPNEAPAGLTAAELTALHAFERAFSIRQVNASTWAHPGVGLNYAANPGYIGSLDGVTATATAEARAADLKYLDGPVPFEDADKAISESYGYLATPLAGAAFKTLVGAPIPGTAETGSLIGQYTVDGREELVITFVYNEYQEQFQFVAHGIISWMTRGIHLGYDRNYFSAHIDDVFLEDLRWSIDGNCTPGDGCPAGVPDNQPIRMTAADVDYLKAWQDRTKMPLDQAYNAEGAATTVGTDALTDKYRANKTSFRWLNHTWSHPYMGCVQDFTVVPWKCATNSLGAIQYMPRATIATEIRKNTDWATSAGVTLDRTELVTGEHSGLKTLPQMAVDNPNLAGALNDRGVRYIASDASREKQPRSIGNAVTVPRYPMNIFYNVATEAEEMDEYNWIYTSRADGGSGICEDNPATTTCIKPQSLTTGFRDYIVPLEVRIALRHVLGNDPRPHYAHQSNLAEDRILYPVLDGVLERFGQAYAANTPLLHPTMKQSSAVLQQAIAWKANQSKVTAYVTGTTLTVQSSSSVAVPVTVPEGTRLVGLLGSTGAVFGTAYAGERSDYKTVGGLLSGSFQLKVPAGYPAPTTTAPATTAKTTTTTNQPAQPRELREPAKVGPLRTGEVRWTSR
ncbi:hypothetical protein [Kribbella deserti]|uniref:Uncharacterized protein n=1 Tax=Kribbella deserti TaxID=1926257 RepID=A0ABV6QT99_9ACTN